MARIAGVDLPREKRVEIGLTYIYGIGRVSSNKILEAANVDPSTRVRDLTDDEVKEHLYLKWVEPIISSLEKVAENLINDFANKLNKLCEKYKTTANDLDERIEKCEKELSDLLLELDAESESDKEGLKDLYSMLISGEKSDKSV